MQENSGCLQWVSCAPDGWAPVFIFTSGSSFTRTWTKHENTQSLPFSYDMKMAAECQLPGAHLALILQFEFNARELLLGIANNNHMPFSASVYLVQSLMH